MSRAWPTDALDSVEGIARGLVAAALPILEPLLLAGSLYHDAVALVLISARPAWLRDHGPAITDRAVAILEQLGPVEVLTPYGRERFLGAGPVAMIRTSPAGNDNTPRETIRSPRGFWRRLWHRVRRRRERR